MAPRTGLTVLSSVLLLLFLVPVARADTVIWTGVNSDWNTAGNWNLGVVPNNNPNPPSPVFYDVQINNANDTVLLDTNPTVTSLTLANSSATVNFNSGNNLTLGD